MLLGSSERKSGALMTSKKNEQQDHEHSELSIYFQLFLITLLPPSPYADYTSTQARKHTS